MQARIFGLETEYSPALRRTNKEFDTTDAAEFMVLALQLANQKLFDSEPISRLLLFPPVGFRFYLGTNGGRFYFDNHPKLPEYATPECLGIRECLVHSMAGDRIVDDIRKETVRAFAVEKKVVSEKSFNGNYTDLHVARVNSIFGAEHFDTIGCHENYMTLVRFRPPSAVLPPEQRTAFHRFRQALVPFLASRFIFDGAGGIRSDAYVVSQRAFFMNALSSPSARGSRGFVHFKFDTSEECAPEHVRLHLHCGDLTMSPFGKYVAMGATHLMLRALEEREDGDEPPYAIEPLTLLSEFYRAASDTTLASKFTLARRGYMVRLKPAEIQRECIEFVLRHVKTFPGEDAAILREWMRLTDLMARNPLDAIDKIDWVIKLTMLKERFGKNLNSAKARLAAFLYHDLSENGIYHRFIKDGVVRRFASEHEIETCRSTPPKTRAEFRTRYIRAALPLSNRISHYDNWGKFAGLSEYGEYINTVVMQDPFARSTSEGEALLRTLEEANRRPHISEK